MQQITSFYPLCRRLTFIFLIAAIAFWNGNPAASAEQAQQSPEPESINVLSNGLIIDWAAGPINWDSTEFGMIPMLDDYLVDAQPGQPQLPYRSVTFAIPAGSTLHTTVLPAKPKPIANHHSIAIAPQPSGVKLNSQSEIIGGRFVAAATTLPTNTQTITVEEIGTMGGVRLGQAVFYPLAYQNGELIWTASASVEIKFKQNVQPFSSDTSSKIETLSSSFLPILEPLVANPEHIQLKQTNRSREAIDPPTTALAVVQVEGAGMVRLGYEDLVDFGLDPGRLNPTQLQVTQAGNELSLRLIGDGDDQFEEEEAVIFYAPPAQSRWSTTSPFLLHQKTAGTSQMQTRSGTSSPAAPTSQLQARILIEENLLYTPDCACGNLPQGWDGDRWIWRELRRPGNATVSLKAELENVDPSQAANITLWFIGFTDQTPNATTDHSVQVKLNGESIGTASWDGKTAHTVTFDLQPNLLQKDNTLDLELVETGGEIDGVWLDAVEFSYGHAQTAIAEQIVLEGRASPSAYQLPLEPSPNLAVYDVSDPLNPLFLDTTTLSANTLKWDDQGQENAVYALVSENNYLTPVSISPSQGLSVDPIIGADYVVVAPQAFVASGGLEPLVKLRQGQGLKVVVETAEEIYVAYGDGDPRPEAIREYLNWGYHQWAVRPEMVLLVGDGSSDPKQHKPNNLKTRIPPYLAQADPWIGEVAVDNRFVTVDGSDTLPDMAIGRLPVNSITELNDVVNKILIYENSQGVGTWNKNLLMATDNNDKAGEFDALSDNLIDRFISAPWLPHRIYLGKDGLGVSQMQAEVLEHWKAGPGLVMFNGHSSTHQWGAERLIHLDDVASLNNLYRLPIVMQMTCFTGSFNSPTFNTLDEQLVRQSDGGAIAVWGATGLGVATGHDSLSAGALRSIYVEGESRLGMALMAGKLQLVADKSPYLDLLDTFGLLGDPALNINLAVTGQEIYLPLIDR
ncbi:MAG: C25 family cysteine peptidase [Anaerolineae bacterium]